MVLTGFQKVEFVDLLTSTVIDSILQTPSLTNIPLCLSPGPQAKTFIISFYYLFVSTYSDFVYSLRIYLLYLNLP